MAELIAAFALGVLYKEALSSWEHLRGPLLAALPIVGHLCNVGCRRVKNAISGSQLKNHACVPTLKITRPKKRTFSDVSDLMKDLNQVPQNSPIVEPVASPVNELPVLPGKRAVSGEESGPVKIVAGVYEGSEDLLDVIKDSEKKRNLEISSAIQQELFHKDQGLPESITPPTPEVAPATQLDLLVTSRRDQHENSLAEETLIPCTKPSNKFVSLELETTH